MNDDLFLLRVGRVFLRKVLLRDLFLLDVEIQDFVDVLAENFLGDGGTAHGALVQVASAVSTEDVAAGN